MDEEATPLDGAEVGNLMVSDPVTVAPQATVADVVRVMAARGIGAVLVTVRDRPVGIFSERDLLQHSARLSDGWTRRPVADFMTPDPITVGRDAPWTDAIDLMDRRRIRHLPVVAGDRLVGILSLRDLLRYRTRHLEALVNARTAELARQNALLEQRDYERTHHLRIAGRTQVRMLPTLTPGVQPVAMAIRFRPYDQVTGDYYDFLPQDPDRLAVLIADASGHGVPAAFVSVMAKMCFRLACRDLVSPAAILGRMNECFSDLLDEHFITMFVASLDHRTGTVSYANAGHPPPLLLRRATGAVVPLDGHSLMIGVDPISSFTDRQTSLGRGDKLLLYTDGISECQDAQGQMLGIDGLRRFLGREGDRSCEDLLDRLLAFAETFRGSPSFGDDLTLICLEYPHAS